MFYHKINYKKTNTERTNLNRIHYILIIVFIIFFAYLFLKKTVCQVKTNHLIPKIIVTIGNTLGKKPMIEYRLSSEILNRYPSFPVKNKRIVDGGGNPMKVTMERIGNQIRIKILSTELMGNVIIKTKIIDEFYYIDEYDLLNLFKEGEVWTDLLIIE